jgi:hypothetical protein
VTSVPYPFNSKMAKVQLQRLSGNSYTRAPIRGPLILRNAAKWHPFGRFALPKNALFEPHSEFPDSL